MNPINAFKKCLLNILVPYIEDMPYLEGTNKKKKNLSQDQRFRDLFKKRKSTLIVGALVFSLMVFGIGKSFSFFTGLILFSLFLVIFWSTFGEQLMGMFKFKKNKKETLTTSSNRLSWIKRGWDQPCCYANQEDPNTFPHQANRLVALPYEQQEGRK